MIYRTILLCAAAMGVSAQGFPWENEDIVPECIAWVSNNWEEARAFDAVNETALCDPMGGEMTAQQQDLMKMGFMYGVGEPPFDECVMDEFLEKNINMYCIANNNGCYEHLMYECAHRQFGGEEQAVDACEMDGHFAFSHGDSAADYDCFADLMSDGEWMADHPMTDVCFMEGTDGELMRAGLSYAWCKNHLAPRECSLDHVIECHEFAVMEYGGYDDVPMLCNNDGHPFDDGATFGHIWKECMESGMYGEWAEPCSPDGAHYWADAFCHAYRQPRCGDWADWGLIVDWFPEGHKAQDLEDAAGGHIMAEGTQAFLRMGACDASYRRRGRRAMATDDGPTDDYTSTDDWYTWVDEVCWGWTSAVKVALPGDAPADSQMEYWWLPREEFGDFHAQWEDKMLLRGDEPNEQCNAIDYLRDRYDDDGNVRPEYLTARRASAKKGAAPGATAAHKHHEKLSRDAWKRASLKRKQAKKAAAAASSKKH